MDSCMSNFGQINQIELSAGLAQLKAEHPSLLEKLESLLRLTEQIDKEIEAESTFANLITNVRLFKEELDPHSEREEGILFPMMGEYIGTTSGPIAVMEYEHDQAKTLLKSFLEKTKQEHLSKEDIKITAGWIKDVYAILTEHFAKEENILFPMAEKILSDEEKAELYQNIQKI